MSDYAHITDHPDFQDIVSKIVVGDSPKIISNWLKTKYSTAENKHLQVSAKDLQDFADKHGDLESVLRRDIVAVQSGALGKDQEISSSLLNNKTYQERLLELAGKQVDIKKLLNELAYMCKERMMQVFDRIQENPSQFKADYALIKWMELLVNLVEKFDKIVNNAPDQIVQHNITIQAVEQHTALFQEAVRETLAEIDVEAALLFMDKLSAKMQKMKQPEAPKVMTTDEQLVEAELIREMVLKK